MSRLSRWSHRKRGERLDAPAGQEAHERSSAASRPETTAEATPTPAAPPAPGHPDDALPDPDSLPPGSDIKAFLAAGVSAELRRRALRRLFAADHYNLRDGLDDYDDDYRQRLQPLTEEVAQRLRRWTESSEAPEHEAEPSAPDETDHDRETTSAPDQTVEDAAGASKPEPPPPSPTGATPGGATLDEGRTGRNVAACRH